MVNFKLTINLLRWVGGLYASDFDVILVQVKLDSNIPSGTELSNISAFFCSFKGYLREFAIFWMLRNFYFTISHIYPLK